MTSEEERTIYCNNLSERITEELLFELFLQAAPIEKVKIPKDQQGRQASYAFITLKYMNSMEFTMLLLDGLTVFDRKIHVKPRSMGNKEQRPRINREPPPQDIKGRNMFYGPNNLLAMANNIAFSNVIVSDEHFNGGRHPGHNRRDRNYHMKDDRRGDYTPYNRYDNRRDHRRNENGNYHQSQWRQ